MTKKEMFDFLDNQTMLQDDNLQLIAESTNVVGEVEYVFVDELGINITINPTARTFWFLYIVDSVYQLTSGKLSSFDVGERLIYNYDRFKSSVLKLKKH